MTTRRLWTLPVPSTALLGSGPTFAVRPKREVALHFSYEGEGASQRAEALVFRGVEAFKCTDYLARDASTLVAYDQLVDRGSTAWLEEVRAHLEGNGSDPRSLGHLMINFDDGPAYEVICRSFRVEANERLGSRPSAEGGRE